MKKMEKQKKKHQLYCRKKWIAILTSVAMIGTATYILVKRQKYQRIRENADGIVGYTDFSLLTNFLMNKINQDNYVLLDIGDHKTDGVYFLKEKLDYCQKNQIAVGLILSSQAECYSDIYLDFLFVQKLVQNYSIDYPIYFNIDSILDNPKLSYQEANWYIDAFLEKGRENHLFLGIYGSSYHLGLELSRIKSCYSSYPLFVWDDSWQGDIQVCDFSSDQSYLLLKDQNFKAVKQEWNYNDPLLFQPLELVSLEDKSLEEVALASGLSVNDLLTYNGVQRKNIEDETFFEIPSQSFREKNHVLSKTGVGVDVSLWQGEIDWSKVVVDYAIIQLRDFANDSLDPQFYRNVEGCLQNEIEMGFYVFSRATSIEALKEEIWCIQENLANLPVHYPVYLDLETEFWQNKTLDEYQEEKDFIFSFLLTYEKEMKKCGYIPGIYCNQDIYQKLKSTLDYGLDDFSIWLAGGEYYDQVLDFDSLPEVSQEESVGMRQISSRGMVEGISCPVDLDYCYFDYSTWRMNLPIDREFRRWNHEIEWGSRGGILFSGFGIFLFGKRKIKKLKKRGKLTKN